LDVRVLFIFLLTTGTIIGQLPIAVIDFDGKGISQQESSALTDRLRSELI